MMNRTAETLFWIGRYLERVENHTRLIDVNFHMRHELFGNKDHYKWERLIASISNIELFNQLYEHANETSALQFLTFDQRNPNSLFSCVLYTRNNIRALRQLLPSELWDRINEFYLWFSEQDISRMMMQSPFIFYQRIKEWLSIFNGTADSTMVRDQAWNFFKVGKYFERAENSLRILHNSYMNFAKDELPIDNQVNYSRFIILLKSVGGYEAFRKLNADNVSILKMIEFIILNPTFPRSVRYSLSKMEINLTKVKQQDFQFDLLAEIAIDLVTKIRSIFADSHEKTDHSFELNLIEALSTSIYELGIEISEAFFQEEFVEA